MPKHIKTLHLERMFPFEFYDELNQNMQGYTLHNPAFLLSNTYKLNQKERKDIYINLGKEMQNHAQDTFKQLHENNIISVEPFGEVLLLDLCVKDSIIDDLIKNKFTDIEKSQQELCVLAVQLYDTSDSPVFSEHVTEKTITQIPEVLWDDPNLGIYIIIFNDKGVNVGIVNIPKQIKSKILKPKE